MIIHLILWSLLVSSTPAQAADDWICTEESSVRRGNTILACGIGEDQSEAAARIKALDAAKAEFKKLCEMTDDCQEHAVIVTPGRTVCQAENSGHVCRRLLYFQMGEDYANGSRGSPQSRVYIGMPKRFLSSILGEAYKQSVLTDYYSDFPHTMLFYQGPPCVYSGIHCYVVIQKDKVTDIHNIKPSLLK